jgi:hypothetical protein
MVTSKFAAFRRFFNFLNFSVSRFFEKTSPQATPQKKTAQCRRFLFLAKAAAQSSSSVEVIFALSQSVELTIVHQPKDRFNKSKLFLCPLETTLKCFFSFFVRSWSMQIS